MFPLSEQEILQSTQQGKASAPSQLPQQVHLHWNHYKLRGGASCKALGLDWQ